MIGDAMTPQAFRDLRATLGLRQKDVAWMFSVEPRQVVRWEAGDYAIPASVSLLMLAYRDGLITPKWMVQQIGLPE